MNEPQVVNIVANVTQMDIQEGEVGDCRSCPLARAILRKLRKYGVNSVSVQEFSLWAFSDDQKMLHAFTTQEARFFIADFDSYNRVEPGKYKFSFDHVALSC